MMARRVSRTDASPRQRLGMWQQVSFAVGERRRTVGALVLTSFLSAICESTTLVLIAQIAVALVKRGNHVAINIAQIPVHASTGTLVALAVAMALLRLVLQLPL